MIPSNKADSILRNPVSILLIILTLVIIASGTYVYIQWNKKKQGGLTTGMRTIQPTPTPTKLYPDDGVKGTYNISSSQTAGPRIIKIVFDPFDVKKGQQLTMTATIINDVPVQKVTGAFSMDSVKGDIRIFTFVSRNEKTETWQSVYASLPDSVQYMYSLTVKAESSNGIGVGGASPRSR